MGAVGAENTKQTDDFDLSIDLSNESNYILGSHMSLIFKKDISVLITVKDEAIDTTLTNDLGGYEFNLKSSAVPEGTEEVKVVANGETIRTIPVTGVAGESSAATIGGFLATVLAVLVAMVTI